MLKRKEVLPAVFEPGTFLSTFAKEFDRVFEDRAASWPFFVSRPEIEQIAWRPELEIFELENLLKVRVDLPGIKKEEVNIEVSDVGLTISGERKREKEEKKGEYLRSERVYGAFFRTIPLPEFAKLDEVKAVFADGVLEVTVPLAARIEPQKRTIPIGELPVKTKTAA
jgi:HSP20 family protein